MMRIFNICLLCTVFITGCQKTPQNAIENEQQQKQPSVKTKSANHECQTLSQNLEKIGRSSTVESLTQANTQLKKCMTQADNTQQLKWLDDSTKMYKRFLDADTDEKSLDALSEYSYSILDNENNHPDRRTSTIQVGSQELFKKLAKRDQYLLKHQGQAYIEFQYIGEGVFEYRRQPQYILDIFAPALPKDQQRFVKQMAKDNQDILYNDAALTISWNELVNRALFWENYLKQYPNAKFKTDAQSLLDEYRYLIFLGVDNSPVSDEFAPNTWIDPDALAAIKALAKRTDTNLASTAQKFLDFIATPIEQRSEKFQIVSDSDIHEASVTSESHETPNPYEQLKSLLQLSSPWEKERQKDCHVDAICIQI